MNLADLQAAEQTVKQYTADFRSIKKLEDALAFAVRVVGEVEQLSAKKTALESDLASVVSLVSAAKAELAGLVALKDQAQTAYEHIRETIRSFGK